MIKQHQESKLYDETNHDDEHDKPLIKQLAYQNTYNTSF
jgi:hypothetical protein